MAPQSIEDFARDARRRLPRFLADYIDGGAYSELTLARNVADMADVQFRQHIFRDVSAIDLEATILGETWAAPFALGPVGLAGMFARRGEVQASIAAERAGIPFCLSTLSVCSLEEVSATVTRPPWFQLYMMRDRAVVADLLDRAHAGGCRVLVITGDMPVPATRYRDFRSGLSGSPGLPGQLRRAAQALRRPSWIYDVALRGRPHALGNLRPVLGSRSGLKDCAHWIARNFDASVTWRDLDWVRERWTGPIIIKGVLTADDAKDAASWGADGIVVSNHGGRQMDGVPSTMRVLPSIASAVGDWLTVLVDGGVRSGLDVMRMLAAGAQGVLLGRAWAYALAAGGGNGVASMIDNTRAELMAGMAMAGCGRITDIDTSVIENV